MTDRLPICFIIHTANRPHFLYRLLRYLSSQPNPRWRSLIVADGSDEEKWAQFEDELRSCPLDLDYRLVRPGPGILLHERLELALRGVDESYVLLGADDDFYLFDWLDTAVAMLESDDALEVVFGQYMTFALPQFTAFGSEVEFAIAQNENPPIPWLEGGSARERLEALGAQQMGFASVGWYALQRRETLKIILHYGRDCRLGPLMFERFMVLAQVATGMIRMIDELFIVRQIDTHLRRPPFGLNANADDVTALRRCSVAFLTEQAGFPASEAEYLADRTLGPEIKLMKIADRKRFARAIADRVPFIRTIWRRLRPIPISHVRRDPQLPPTPSPEQYPEVQQAVRAALVGSSVAPQST